MPLPSRAVDPCSRGFVRSRRTRPPLFAILATLALLGGATPSLAQNEIAVENALPGQPASEWDVSGSGDPSIQGFATDISVDAGGTVLFKVATDASDYRIDVYRIGWYGGLGARRVATVQPSVSLPQTQPAPLTDPTTGLVDCGNWAVSASWAVPANAVSGVYVAKLVREDPEDGRASHVLFVVRDDDGGSDLLFQTNDATWQAYNTYGGNSLYFGAPAGRAYKVSYNRPVQTRCCSFPNGAIVTWFFAAQYPMIRWLESNGYDVSYTTNVDSERRGAEILEHRVFLSVGHDEYWSAGQRANVEAARAAGVHLAFFSGNEVFWKTRFEPSIDGTTTDHRTLVCYKETHANAKIDPLPGAWTGTWRDPRFSPPADGGRPENALMGTIFTVNGIRNDALAVPEADGKMRFWRNTSVASLPPGQTAAFDAGTLGFEWDEDLDNGFRPPGLVRLSTATVSGVPLLQDYGSTYASGTATHHATLYRHASGALVFSAGTVQWSWGLDATHDVAGPPADPRMQQATVNLFADMGVQPATLRPGLVAASPSTDGTPPTAQITSPAPGANVTSGTSVTIFGTAADAGGRVGGVEVSPDGGTTWHPAEGRESWSYTWVPGAVGSATLRARPVDDSANLDAASAGVTVNVNPAAGGVCPCHLFDVAGGPAANDPLAVELGVRVRADRPGSIRGLRFYKPGATTGGVKVGSLWSNGGTLLRSATFTDETAAGWQEVLFPAGQEVPVAAETLVVASVFFPQGNYAATALYFAAAGVDRAPLHAPRDGAGGFPNGVYRYGGGFPTSTFQSTNYWVDVVFDTVAAGGDLTPPVITGVGAAPGTTTATITWTTDEPSDSRVDYGTTAGSLPNTASSSANVTSHALVLGPLSGSTTYYFRVRSQDASGNAATSPAPPAAPASFATGGACLADATTSDFAAGTFGTGTSPAESADGEVILTPALAADFSGTALPAGWSGTPWSAGGTVAVAAGALEVDGARALTAAGFGTGRSLEFAATFGGDPFQHVGLSADADLGPPWVIFSTFTGGGLWARASNGTNVAIAGNWLGGRHRYRIAREADAFECFVDDVLVATLAFSTPADLRPFVSDFTPAGNRVHVDWLRLSPYASSGTYTSRVADAGGVAAWGAATWSTDTPAGTSLALSVRRGNTPVPDGSWTAFASVPSSGAIVGGPSRFVQYRAELSSTDPAFSPALRDLSIACALVPNEAGPAPAAGMMRVTPNPIRSAARFEYAIPPEEGPAGRVRVALTLHDAQGRLVRVLERRDLVPGAHRADWDGRDASGTPVEPGIYWYRLASGGSVRTGRLAVVR